MNVFARSEQLREEVLTHLKHKLKSPLPEVRKWAVASLKAFAPEEAHPLLLDMLADPDPGVRVAVVWNLRDYDQFDTYNALVRALHTDTDEEVRWTAARALSHSKLPLAGFVLLKALQQDSSQRVRQAATLAIMICPHISFPVLRELILSEHEPTELRLQATRAVVKASYLFDRPSWVITLLYEAPELVLEILIDRCIKTRPALRPISFESLRTLLRTVNLTDLIARVDQVEKELGSSRGVSR